MSICQSHLGPAFSAIHRQYDIQKKNDQPIDIGLSNHTTRISPTLRIRSGNMMLALDGKKRGKKSRLWSTQNTMQLIALLESYSELWNASHPMNCRYR